MTVVLRGLYWQENELGQMGREPLAAIDTLTKLDPAGYVSRGGAVYPQSDFGHILQQIAMLIMAQAGLEVAAVALPYSE